jgi:hypothetical protein
MKGHSVVQPGQIVMGRQKFKAAVGLNLFIGAIEIVQSGRDVFGHA